MVTGKEQSCIVLAILWTLQGTVVFVVGGQICLRELSKYLKLGIFFPQKSVTCFDNFFKVGFFSVQNLYTLINYYVHMYIWGCKFPSFTVFTLFNSWFFFPLTATVNL